MNYKKMLREHQKARAKQSAQYETKQQQIVDEIYELRRTIANLQTEAADGHVAQAQARINKDALLVELNQTLKQLVEKQRDFRNRQAAIERNFDKQAAFLENQIA